MEQFNSWFPLPASEAERCMVLRKYALMEIKLPIQPIEDVLASTCNSLGDELMSLHVSLIDKDTARVGGFCSRWEGTGWNDWTNQGIDPVDLLGVRFPRKFSACQYVVAEGQVKCAKVGGERKQDKLLLDLTPKIELLPSLVETDSAFVRFPEQLACLENPMLIADKTQRNAFINFVMLMSKPGCMYVGMPIRINGQVVGTLCAVFEGIKTAEIPEAMQWKLEAAADCIGAGIVASQSGMPNDSKRWNQDLESGWSCAQ